MKILAWLNSSFHSLTFTKLRFWSLRKKLLNRPLSFATVAVLPLKTKKEYKKNNTWHLT